MTSIGIVCEYNPFHNGHLYQINKIKELYPDSLIICIMGTNFLQRGETSLNNKWDKTSIALNYVDLVIELPFIFSSQSADIFAKGAIQILSSLKVDKIVFGSETDNIDIFNKLVDTELRNEEFDRLAKQYLQSGMNYPTALSKSLYDITKINVDTPNDLLGLSYVKEIKKQNSLIEPICIKRTNNYHDITLNNKIVSASAIRTGIIDHKEISPYVPKDVVKYLNKDLSFIDNYYPFLKYKILTTPDLSIYQTVDEGIEHRIMKYINHSNSLEELISKIKTKRYTYNKLKRMFTHILCGLTKEEAKNNDIEYIRVLGFNDKGRQYLNSIKNKTNVPVITGYSNIDSKMLDIEYRVNCVYCSIFDEQTKNELIEREKNKPIYK